MADPVAVLEQLAREAVVPKDVRQLRACIGCHLVKHVKQFERDGCENCEQSHGDDYEDKMSVNFTGVAAIMQPNQSWVARWLRKQNMVPGCYALEVAGESFDT
mmetsp:Transcript_5500/g.13367  ORF Transcript_5500/g.13367 Transcript_5500/m.13367 type:complete len:103 (+) Transcript_5500:37-345(+)|eukprot:CAMPEP_0180151782 /NCGR_PEP_ID=MMETSP0986-20121125/22351_1 /TAXON_ID=697907 /ORGANISM="non described non described, Strain CCMP2293" /LENGTH=102 /DNA_ID=CAMNT_0022099177 /DNA_START=32 /DNA_END=340 /DNA_ORIENTATION=+